MTTTLGKATTLQNNFISGADGGGGGGAPGTAAPSPVNRRLWLTGVRSRYARDSAGHRARSSTHELQDKVGQDAAALQRIHFAGYLLSYVTSFASAYMVTYFGYFYIFPQGLILYFLLHTLMYEGRLWRVIFETTASEASCPTPGQVAPGREAGSLGIMGQDAPCKRRGGHHEYAAIENLELHSELNYILYFFAVT